LAQGIIEYRRLKIEDWNFFGTAVIPSEMSSALQDEWNRGMVKTGTPQIFNLLS
jgi:hypothetical protein